MKKFILFLSILIFTCSVVNADELSDKINVLYAQNNLKEAFELLISIPQEQRTSQNWLLLGNILEDEGKLDEAIFMYHSAIALDEKDYKAHYNLANAYLSQDKPNLAVEEFKKVIKYNPNFAYGYYNLGCTYLKLGKIKQAKLEFLRAIEKDNQVADFHYNLAYTYKQLKNDKQAQVYLDYYNKLMEMAK